MIFYNFYILCSSGIMKYFILYFVHVLMRIKNLKPHHYILTNARNVMIMLILEGELPKSSKRTNLRVELLITLYIYDKLLLFLAMYYSNECKGLTFKVEPAYVHNVLIMLKCISPEECG